MFFGQTHCEYPKAHHLVSTEHCSLQSPVNSVDSSEMWNHHHSSSSCLDTHRPVPPAQPDKAPCYRWHSSRHQVQPPARCFLWGWEVFANLLKAIGFGCFWMMCCFKIVCFFSKFWFSADSVLLHDYWCWLLLRKQKVFFWRCWKILGAQSLEWLWSIAISNTSLLWIVSPSFGLFLSRPSFLQSPLLHFKRRPVIRLPYAKRVTPARPLYLPALSNRWPAE